MYVSEIVLSSAGSLCIATIALFFCVFQGWLWIRKPELSYNGWGAMLSCVTALYAAAVFVQFNTPPNWINHLAELLQHTSIVVLIHSIYGYTFSYLGLPAKRYHQLAGAFHGLLLVLIWFSGLIFTDEFIHRDFYLLDRSYIEPKMGLLGPYYLGYVALAALYSLRFWIKHGRAKGRSGTAFIVGLLTWAVFGLHDAVATLGVRTVQFFMEYGFLGFSSSMMYATLKSYIELHAIAAQREERLAAEKERLDVTLRSIGDGFIATDIQGRVVMINKAAENLTGWSQQKALGSPVEMVIRKQPREEENDAPGAGAPGAPGAGLPGATKIAPWSQDGFLDSSVLVALDGTERSISETRSPIHDASGKVVGTVLILRDTTERKRLHEKLIQSQKLEAIGVLAGGVAHDLNNVLAGLVSYPDLLLMQLSDDSPLRGPIVTMKKSGERAAAMVQDLLTLARRGVSTSQVVDLNQIIADLLKTPECLNILKYHPHVQIETRTDDALKNILGSPVHLSKALLNLVSNAAEALPEGGSVVITTANRRLEHAIKGYEDIEAGEYVTLSVSDNGTGISAEDMKKIFEPFYTKKVMGRSGTGLGMPVVWGTVKDSKGYVDVVSTLGQRTTFTLYFPVTRRTSSQQRSDLSIDAFLGRGETVLVIDDVEDQREIATRILERLGYRVKTSASGEEAVAYLQDNSVDLLVLDMIMDPGIDGLETYRRILARHPGQKAILTTGYTETESIREAQRLGAGAYIKKPYSLERLGRALRAEIDRNP